jgi:hypothetical protein
VSGPDIEVFTPQGYADAKLRKTLPKKPYVRMSWPETARSATNDWPGAVIPWLDSLSEGKPIRLVLGFDS